MNFISNIDHQSTKNCDLSSVICHLSSDSLGQTLIELLVALTLITLFLSGVVVVQLYALRNVSYAQKRSQATKLAREQLERLKVVRDSAGIDMIASCLGGCYINNQLTPIPISPTGTFGQLITLTTANALDCPPPDITITPIPIIYKATVNVKWGQGNVQITPAPELALSSCITDWR